MSESGFVYAAVNPAFPHLIKIGGTARDPSGRIAEFSAGTGIPYPFALVHSVPVVDWRAAETAVHRVLQQYRDNRHREFFALSPAEAIRIIDSTCRAERSGVRFWHVDVGRGDFIASSEGAAILKKHGLFSLAEQPPNALQPGDKLLIESGDAWAVSVTYDSHQRGSPQILGRFGPDAWTVSVKDVQSVSVLSVVWDLVWQSHTIAQESDDETTFTQLTREGYRLLAELTDEEQWQLSLALARKPSI